jgi:hypothetical protein
MDHSHARQMPAPGYLKMNTTSMTRMNCDANSMVTTRARGAAGILSDLKSDDMVPKTWSNGCVTGWKHNGRYGVLRYIGCHADVRSQDSCSCRDPSAPFADLLTIEPQRKRFANDLECLEDAITNCSIAHTVLLTPSILSSACE